MTGGVSVGKAVADGIVQEGERSRWSDIGNWYNGEKLLEDSESE